MKTITEVSARLPEGGRHWPSIQVAGGLFRTDCPHCHGTDRRRWDSAGRHRLYSAHGRPKLLLFGLLGLSCSVTAQYFAAKAAYGFGTMLRRDLFAHINRLSFAELDRAGTSTLITRITGDINQVQSGVNLVLRLFLRSPFIVLGR